MSVKIQMLKTLKEKQCLDDLKTLKNKKQLASLWFKELRDRICKSFVEIENNKINRDELIYILKKNKEHNNKNHKLISVLQYNIDLEPEDVLNYLKYKEKYNFLTIVSEINDILWNETINIFKNLNSLHIVYYEEPKKKQSTTKKVYIRNAKLKRKKHTRKRT